MRTGTPQGAGDRQGAACRVCFLKGQQGPGRRDCARVRPFTPDLFQSLLLSRAVRAEPPGPGPGLPRAQSAALSGGPPAPSSLAPWGRVGETHPGPRQKGGAGWGWAGGREVSARAPGHLGTGISDSALVTNSGLPGRFLTPTLHRAQCGNPGPGG